MRAKIFYFTLQDEQTKQEKLDWFEQKRFETIPFDHITPDQKADWINLTDNDFDSFLALVDKQTKDYKSCQSIFSLFSRGIETGRDEWIYDFSERDLENKIKFFIGIYSQSIKNKKSDFQIKWNSSLRTHAENKLQLSYSKSLIIDSAWRPFTRKYFYSEKASNHRLTQNHYGIYGYSPALKSENSIICCTDAGTQSPFMVTATHNVPDLHLVGTAAQCLPLYRYDENGNRIDNITDWGLTQFQTHYRSPSIPLKKGEEESESPFLKGAGGIKSPNSTSSTTPTPFSTIPPIALTTNSTLNANFPACPSMPTSTNGQPGAKP